MNWKIQVPGMSGWADLKGTSDDGETYAVCLYPTEAEALDEVDCLVESLDDFEARVVREDVPQDFDLYD